MSTKEVIITVLGRDGRVPRVEGDALMSEPRDIEGQPLAHGDEVLIRARVNAQCGEGGISCHPIDERYGIQQPPVLVEARLVKKARNLTPPFNEGSAV